MGLFLTFWKIKRAGERRPLKSQNVTRSKNPTCSKLPSCKMKMKMEWLLLLCGSGFSCVKCHFFVWFFRTLSYAFVHTSVDHIPSLGSIVLHRIDLNFNSMSKQFVTLTSNTGPIIVALESILSVWILHHLEKTYLFRHEPAHPSPAN